MATMISWLKLRRFFLALCLKILSNHGEILKPTRGPANRLAPLDLKLSGSIGRPRFLADITHSQKQNVEQFNTTKILLKDK